jgi:membrane protein required for colicin V production
MFPDLQMNWLDWLITGVIIVSTLVSVMRGFVKEALSLASWAVAFFLAMTFAGQLSVQLQPWISNDSLRYASAYVILFAATLMVGGLLNRLLTQIIKSTGLGGLDRLLGTAFGFTRGLVLVMVVLYVARTLIPEQEQEIIQESAVLPHLTLVVDWAEQRFSGLLASQDVPWSR